MKQFNSDCKLCQFYDVCEKVDAIKRDLAHIKNGVDVSNAYAIIVRLQRNVECIP